MLLKDKIIQKLDVISNRYLAELSAQEEEKAQVMLNEVKDLIEKVIFQNQFNKQERKEDISRKEFTKLLDVLDEEESFVKQKNLLMMTSLKNKFTVSQVYRMLHCIEEEKDKYTILELLIPSISNPKDMYRLFEYIKNLSCEV